MYVLRIYVLLVFLLILIGFFLPRVTHQSGPPNELQEQGLLSLKSEIGLQNYDPASCNRFIHAIDSFNDPSRIFNLDETCI